jgi:hypothetical protein
VVLAFPVILLTLPTPAAQTRQYEGNLPSVGYMGLLGGW